MQGLWESDIKVKLDATTAPTVNNDTDEGYDVGSRWVDVTADKEYVCLDNSNGAAVWTETTGGGGIMPEYGVNCPAGSFLLPSTNYAPLDKDTGTNGTIWRHLFDDSTEEFVELAFVVPQNITAGDVTFEFRGYASTWVTGKNVEFRISHSAKQDGESWDAAYTTLDSGDLALNTTAQDVIDVLSFTATVGDLGWVAGDQIRIRVSRIDASANDLVGDFGLTHFKIRIPQG